MDAVYRQLCKKYPDMATKSEKKLTDLKENWERLEDLASARYVDHILLTDNFNGLINFQCSRLLCIKASLRGS